MALINQGSGRNQAGEGCPSLNFMNFQINLTLDLKRLVGQVGGLGYGKNSDNFYHS